MILELAFFLAAAPRQDPATPPAAPTVSLEAAMLRDLKNQPLGNGTVEDLALPDEFLNRVGDRRIRAWFEGNSRVVVADPPAESALPPKNASQPVDSTTFQPPSAMNLPLVIGSILLVAFIAYIAITARARKETPL